MMEEWQTYSHGKFNIMWINWIDTNSGTWCVERTCVAYNEQ